MQTPSQHVAKWLPVKITRIDIKDDSHNLTARIGDSRDKLTEIEE